MKSRKLLSIVSFTGLPQNGFLSSPFQSTFFPSLKIISALSCERRIISPPSPSANTEYQAKFQELRLEE